MNQHRRREAKRARRRHRKATGKRGATQFKGGWRACVDAGAEKLLGAVARLPQPDVKGRPAVTRIPVPCECDPPVNHGPHWVTPTGEEQERLAA